MASSEAKLPGGTPANSRSMRYSCGLTTQDRGRKAGVCPTDSQGGWMASQPGCLMKTMPKVRQTEMGSRAMVCPVKEKIIS